MHIHIDQGVNFSKLAKNISKFKSWENYFWRTLVAFCPLCAVKKIEFEFTQ